MNKDAHKRCAVRFLPAICVLLTQLLLFGCAAATPKDTDDPPMEAVDSSIQSVVSSVTVNDVAGVFRSGQLPAQSGGPTISLTGNDTVINGGAFFLSVQSQSTSSVESLIVALEGEDRGYYEVDLSGASESSNAVAAATSNQRPTYDVRGQVSQDVDDDFSIVVIASDDSGVGPPQVHDFELIEVGTGSVQVSLSWDVDSDVDLHVIDPNGDEVYYSRRSVPSGGTLDLDSNAGCSVDRIRNENVTWPEGEAPSGTYTVRVDYWSSCSVSETSYVVTMTYGGQQQVFDGSFTGPGDRGSAGSGRTIGTFTL